MRSSLALVELAVVVLTLMVVLVLGGWWLAFMAAVGAPWSFLWRRPDNLVARVRRLIIVVLYAEDNSLGVANPLIIVSEISGKLQLRSGF